MSAVLKPVTSSGQPDYKVADLSLANWGRKEIKIAETEMPGLMQFATNTLPKNPSRRPYFRIAAYDDPDRSAD